MQHRKSLRPALIFALLLGSTWAHAVKVTAGPNVDLNVGVLLQPRAIVSWDGDAVTGPGNSPAGTLATDFYLRRARLITSGTAFNRFTFYIMLDAPNFGQKGNYGGSAATEILQDVHIGYQFTKEIELEIGFLYMPLSHLAINSSSSTSSLEKGTAILFYNQNRGLRENGIQFRSLLLDRRVYLRVGVFDGAHQPTNPNTNPHDRPLAAGMVRFNILGDEGNAYAVPALYIDGKTRVSVGAGAQWQGAGSNTPQTIGFNPATGARINGPRAGTRNDYLAVAGDVFADVALPDDQEVAFQGDVYRFDWGAGSDRTGWGTTYELGYRWHEFEPEVNGYWFNSDSKNNSFLKVAGGVNFFLQKHNAKLGLEFWHLLSGTNLNTGKAAHLLMLQAQASF